MTLLNKKNCKIIAKINAIQSIIFKPKKKLKKYPDLK